MASLESLGAMIAQQDWAAAERLLRRLARAKDAPAEVFYNLAQVLQAADKPEQRRVWLQRAVARRADYASAWFELGRFELADGDLHAAFKAFEQAFRSNPADADARRNLGRIALRLGHWEVASDCFGRSADAEAQLARYRVAAETGVATDEMRAALLALPGARRDVLKTLTRTAKGAVPLVLDQFDRT